MSPSPVCCSATRRGSRRSCRVSSTAACCAGMILVGVGGGAFAAAARRAAPLDRRRLHRIGAGAQLGLAHAAHVGPGWPLAANIAALGFANGVFAVAAIGAMMALAGAGGGGREGIRMGVWGAAQAVAFGLGGLTGAVGVDVGRAVIGSTPRDLHARVRRARRCCSSSRPRVALRGAARTVASVARPRHDRPIYDVRRGRRRTRRVRPPRPTSPRPGIASCCSTAAGRIKPCGGAIPPRLIADFAIPDHLIVGRARPGADGRAVGRRRSTCRSATASSGMVDREHVRRMAARARGAGRGGAPDGDVRADRARCERRLRSSCYRERARRCRASASARAA